jgi:DNA repair protein RecN (Recombination protein N)
VLERLRIRDLALVGDADVELGPGLNVITGETGAGKSLLVHSLNWLVGERADSDRVRDGAKLASVEGEFRLEPATARRAAEPLAEWGVEFDGETLIVRREVQGAGRSRALVNQSALTQGSLKKLGEILADLHGQHDHQSLLRPDAGLEVLDRLGGALPERDAYARARAAWHEATLALERLQASLAAYADRREFMMEAARDLDEARLRVGEDEALAVEAARLAHADRLRALVDQALDRLADGEDAAARSLHAAAHAIEQAAALDPTLAEVAPTLEEARIAAGEAARALADYAGRLESDPRALESLEARRDTIARLVRKHRRSVPELLAWREELRDALATGEDAERALAAATERVARARADVAAAARALSTKRRAAAREWSTRITRELKPLGLPHARIEFAVERLEGDEFSAHGADDVEIRFSANAGEPPRRLQRTASGGELSRVMLALKCALEAHDRVDVLVFDEVDSGIGGAVAVAVGERLRRLARHRQVVCVTHLPMIAALADHHLLVDKRVASGRTQVLVMALDEDARVEEIARMLAGDRATATTRRQAREMLGARVPSPA